MLAFFNVAPLEKVVSAYIGVLLVVWELVGAAGAVVPSSTDGRPAIDRRLARSLASAASSCTVPSFLPTFLDPCSTSAALEDLTDFVDFKEAISSFIASIILINS